MFLPLAWWSGTKSPFGWVMIAGAQARIDRSMDVAVVREAEDLSQD